MRGDLDTQLFFALNGLVGRSPSIDYAIFFFAAYVPYILGVLLVVWLYQDRRPLRDKFQAFVLTGFSVVLSRFMITPIIRMWYDRPRPFLAYEGVRNLLVGTNAGSSFPSGRAAFFFAPAAVVCMFDRRRGVMCYAAAALVTLARIIAGVHYPSDIIAGASIGVLSAYAMQFVLASTCFRISW